MLRWFGTLAILLLCGAASAAETRVVVPLSAAPEGALSIGLVCRSDGIVGPFVDTSRTNRAGSGAVTLFTHSDFARRAEFFDITHAGPPGTLSLPDWWSMAGGDQPGFFIAVANLGAKGRPGALRALAVRAQLLLLQVATSKYVGVEIGDQKSLVQIDASALTPANVARCLREAGLPAALMQMEPESDPATERRERTGLCVTLYNHADALAALVETFAPDRQAALSAAIRHPTRERVDCFIPQALDAEAIGRAAQAAAADAARFDYLGFAAAAAEMPVPVETYAVLREAWGARDLPGQKEAEAQVRKDARLNVMRRIYVQYSRVLACVESLKASRLEPVSSARMVRFRSDITLAERALRAEADLDALWSESTHDYARTAGMLRTAALSSPTYILDKCSGEATKLDTLLARLDGATPQPRRDFGPAVLSEAALR